jgi:hypothetical protein
VNELEQSSQTKSALHGSTGSTGRTPARTYLATRSNTASTCRGTSAQAHSRRAAPHVPCVRASTGPLLRFSPCWLRAPPLARTRPERPARTRRTAAAAGGRPLLDRVRARALTTLPRAPINAGRAAQPAASGAHAGVRSTPSRGSEMGSRVFFAQAALQPKPPARRAGRSLDQPRNMFREELASRAWRIRQP